LRRARRVAAPNDTLLPQQNGVVERQNQTIVGAARSLLMTIEMPERFWREAVMTVVYLLNWSTTQSLDGKALHEV